MVNQSMVLHLEKMDYSNLVMTSYGVLIANGQPLQPTSFSPMVCLFMKHHWDLMVSHSSQPRYGANGEPIYGAPLGEDGQPLQPIGYDADGQPLYAVPIGPDGKPLQPTSFSPDGLPIFEAPLGVDGQPLKPTSYGANGEPIYGAPLGKDGQPLQPIGYDQDENLFMEYRLVPMVNLEPISYGDDGLPIYEAPLGSDGQPLKPTSYGANGEPIYGSEGKSHEPVGYSPDEGAVYGVPIGPDGKPLIPVGFAADGVPVYGVPSGSDGQPLKPTSHGANGPDGQPLQPTSFSSDGLPIYEAPLGFDGQPLKPTSYGANGEPIYGAPTVPNGISMQATSAGGGPPMYEDQFAEDSGPTGRSLMNGSEDSGPTGRSLMDGAEDSGPTGRSFFNEAEDSGPAGRSLAGYGGAVGQDGQPISGSSQKALGKMVHVLVSMEDLWMLQGVLARELMLLEAEVQALLMEQEKLVKHAELHNKTYSGKALNFLPLKPTSPVPLELLLEQQIAECRVKHQDKLQGLLGPNAGFGGLGSLFGGPADGQRGGGQASYQVKWNMMKLKEL
ncbi:Mesocentin [Orchesella cincta]|uniref:Mesocentin n=1 Tax=Orchesella cincta TaxID=48709 RepID=A0A1D2M6C1_ORCCI|nr:Mesocentin [Orchesella cincta]